MKERRLSLAGGRRFLTHLAIAAVAVSFAMIGVARADTDTIALSGTVPVVGNLFNCSGVTAPSGGWVPSAFSFDISWVDEYNRQYYLADRSHGNNNGGDVLVVDLTTTPYTVSYLTPPANDPMAGIACDANAAFGGTTGVGRNEITGPNGAFTVNHTEVWVGDGPGKFQPLQTNSAADYNADPCNSSVRVFSLISKMQTDHINVGGCFRTDEGAFDPVDQVAVFANPSEQSGILHGTALNNSPFLTFISTEPVAQNAHHAILKQINFDGTHGTYVANGGVEQAVWSKDTGLFYVAVPGDTNDPNGGVVAVIDPRNANNIHVQQNFHVTNCSPNGAALGPDYELYLGCTVGPAQVISIIDGHLIKSVTGTTGGCDEVWFNSGDNHFLGACTDSNAGGTDNLDITDADPVNFDQAINTLTKGAHSVAADPVTLTDFVPAAAGIGANAGGLCGSSPCVLLFGPSNPAQDDQSAKNKEISEGNQGPFIGSEFQYSFFFGFH